MLRTIFVLGLLAIGARYSFKAPFYTLLFYLFLAYFRPEYWVWSDFLSSANVSFIVGIWVVGYAFFARPQLAVGKWAAVLLLFLAHTLISALNSPVAGPAFLFWQDFLKTVVIGYLCVVLIDDEKKLRLALYVIAFSLGFEGAKQGWVQLMINPGGLNTNGWPNLGDNNGVGIGMLMLVSIFMALASTSKHWVEQYLHRFFLVGVLYRAISTYSRGAFLSMAALMLNIVLRGKRKVMGVVTIALAAALILPILPVEFWERMGTIRTSATATRDEDVEESAAGRYHFWRVSVIMANENPVFGVGPWMFSRMYDRYDSSDSRFGHNRSVHSAWFGLLAETGYVGLAIVWLLLARAAYVAIRVRRLARRNPEFATLAAYGTAIEGALLVAFVGGTFYPFQYMEPLWHMLALSMVVDRLADKRLAEAADPALAGRVLAGRTPVRTTVQLPRLSARTDTPPAQPS